jgi:hypothetical protein
MKESLLSEAIRRMNRTCLTCGRYRANGGNVTTPGPEILAELSRADQDRCPSW